ncbi:MAG: hypothetical protein ACJAZO_003733 [Myxococcota bacterium]|jgi:hypothetical protein
MRFLVSGVSVKGPWLAVRECVRIDAAHASDCGSTCSLDWTKTTSGQRQLGLPTVLPHRKCYRIASPRFAPEALITRHGKPNPPVIGR